MGCGCGGKRTVRSVRSAGQIKFNPQARTPVDKAKVYQSGTIRKPASTSTVTRKQV